MTTLSNRASYQDHRNLNLVKKPKRLRFVDVSTPCSNPTFKEFEPKYIRAISRGLPSFDPIQTVIDLVNGKTLTVKWVGDKTFKVSLVS